MTKQELFVKYHWKQSLVLLLVVILTAATQQIVISKQITREKNKMGEVKGASTINKQILNNKQLKQNQSAVINYQNQLKYLLKKYFETRANFDKPHQNWIKLINNTKEELRQLSVPPVYKNLHLKIILLLDKEKQAVMNNNQQALAEINTKWEELLKQFFWLN